MVGGELLGVAWWGAIGIVALGLVAASVAVGVPRRALTVQAAALVGFGGSP